LFALGAPLPDIRDFSHGNRGFLTRGIALSRFPARLCMLYLFEILAPFYAGEAILFRFTDTVLSGSGFHPDGLPYAFPPTCWFYHYACTLIVLERGCRHWRWHFWGLAFLFSPHFASVCASGLHVVGGAHLNSPHFPSLILLSARLPSSGTLGSTIFAIRIRPGARGKGAFLLLKISLNVRQLASVR